MGKQRASRAREPHRIVYFCLATSSMPEFRESLAHFLYFFSLWNLHKDKSGFVLLALWADHTAAEVKRTGKGKDGLVQKLDSGCTFKRGSKGCQTALYPPLLRKTKARPHPPSLQSLELKKVEHSSRAIFLYFGSVRLKVAYLTHTSIQWYTRQQWERTVTTVPKENRGKIGLALEFEKYIIAFITNDLVFQPVWEETFNRKTKKSALPPVPPSIYDDYLYFLTKVANWIQGRANRPRSGLACEVVRSSQDVWCGIGVYTVCEIFFDAGLSPFLTEAEVFNCPSRTARLCEAFYAYAHRSYKKLPALLKSATVDGVLAPTEEQRLKYIHWLHVYAKDITRIPIRMTKLVDAYNATLLVLGKQSEPWHRDTESSSLYDVFDPIYIMEALEKKKVNLGHLIFGRQVWEQLNGPPSQGVDPLSCMFAERGLLKSTTNLHLNFYEKLYPSEKKTDYHFRPTYAYAGKKQIWSIVRCFPPNSHSSTISEGQDSRPNMEYTGPERRRRLFSVIVTETQGVAIGPLEYCGNGRIIRLPSGKKKVSLVHKGDPQLTFNQVVREAKREFRLKNNLDQPGKAKGAMTERQRLAQQDFIDRALDEYHACRALGSLTASRSLPPSPKAASRSVPLSDIINTVDTQPRKRRRISQDKKIALLGLRELE